MEDTFDNIGERLEYAFVAAGFERKEFAKAIDIHYETLGKHIRENSLPKSKKTRQAIERVTGFSFDWIETGEGDRRLPQEIPIIARYRTLLHGAPICAAVFDTECRYILATDAYIDSHRIRHHVPLEGKTILDVVDEIPKGADIAGFMERARRGPAPSLLEPKHIADRGFNYWVSYRCTEWYHDDGSRGGFIMVVFLGETKEAARAAAGFRFEEGFPIFTYPTHHVNPLVQTTGTSLEVKAHNALVKSDTPLTETVSKSILDKHVLNLIAAQVQEGKMDRTISASGGVADVQLTQLYTEIEGKMRRVNVVAHIETMDEPEEDAPQKLKKNGCGPEGPQP